ncbi:MAG TPA: hypothetical protein VM683_06685 [Anaeromyxobacteraceae bacterium]|nr:hypothetical protein [Anaeromyxobacteraceae bacterium]
MSSLSELQEKLLAWSTRDERKEELLAARRDWFDRHGEPHEEDKSFETRMNGMLDYYLYDFRPPGSSETTIEIFMRESGPQLTTDELSVYRVLAKSIHGVFEVKKIKKGEVRLRDLFTDALHDVTERRQMVGLEKGDILEARLLPHEGRLFFSGAFLYHPQEVRKLILNEVKRQKKEEGKGTPFDVAAFVASLSRMALKLERYRNVKVESLYDFRPESRPLATPPPRSRNEE